jgi:hypothetical protein
VIEKERLSESRRRSGGADSFELRCRAEAADRQSYALGGGLHPLEATAWHGDN